MSSRAHTPDGRGIALAIVASITFGTSGIVARSLLDAGWSPIAAVMARAFGAALVVAPFAYAELNGDLARYRGSWRRVVGLGLLGVAGSQVCYFAAVQRLPVGIALLIEYQAPVMLIAYTWARTQVVPPRLTLIGAAVATLGVVLILNPTGERLDPVGIAWAGASALCLSAYFYFTGTPDPNRLPPIATTGGALAVGAVALAVVGGVGLLPFSATTNDAELFGFGVAWWVPVVAVIIMSTAIPYVTSVTAMARLGTRLGSFVSLLELLSAIAFAWIVFSETPTAVQSIGGVLIVAGIIAVQNSNDVSPVT